MVMKTSKEKSELEVLKFAFFPPTVIHFNH